MFRSTPAFTGRTLLLAASMLAMACSSDTKIGVRHEPPAVQIVEPSNESSHDAFSSVRFVAQVETYDGSDLTDIEHHWVTGSDVACDWGTVPSDGLAICFMSFDEPGSHSVTVTVKNSRLDTATATISVNIEANSDPEITITSPEDAQFFTPSDAITLEAMVSDAEDSPETLTVVGVSSIDDDLGLTSTPSSAGDWAANLEDLSVGEHLITLTVYDETGLSGQDTVSLTINEPPSAPSVVITPDPAESGVQLTASLTEESTDSEGDPITYEYQWYVGGVEYPGGTTPVVAAGVTQRDEYWEVMVSAKDPYASSAAGVASITIGNSAPRVDAVTISPFSPVTSDDLTALATGWFDQDLDPESYNYEWEVDGEIDIEETTDTFPYEKTVRGYEVRVTLTPKDAFAEGEPVSSTLTTIENSPPVGGEALIIPEAPEPTDDLFCNVEVASSDADGDSITYMYQWFLDGIMVPGMTTASVPALETSDSETWTCEVTPTDGVEDGATFSDSTPVTDGSAPPPPEISTPSAHRNKDFMDLTGYCEASCILDFYCEDEASTWTIVDTCTTEGTFSVTVDPMTRGEITTCYATCTDEAGNTSGDSLPVSSEVCDPEDIYENGSYGDSLDDPADEWSVLDDDGSTTINIIGNVLEDDDEDWYIISAGDNVSADIAAGRDDFRFEVSFAGGASAYSFVVYRDDPLGADADSCMPDADGYTEYSWYYETSDDGTFRGLPADLQSCDGGSISLNTCEDNSSDFFVQVFRNSSEPASCSGYQLQLTNGVW